MVYCTACKSQVWSKNHWNHKTTLKHLKNIGKVIPAARTLDLHQKARVAKFTYKDIKHCLLPSKVSEFCAILLEKGTKLSDAPQDSDVRFCGN